MVSGQMSGPINGLDPLIYTGGLPNLVIMNRRPTENDYQEYFLGHWWIIPSTSSGDVNTEVWILVSKRFGIAKWKKLYLFTRDTTSFFIKKQYITATGAGVYTPTTGMKSCFVECIGGGGAAATSNGFANNMIVCPGGGAGGYCAKFFLSDEIGASQNYVVGAGGGWS